MKRVTVDMAAQATGLFDVHRFCQRTKAERESAWHAFRALGVASDAEACETITKILNREVKASDELTEAELDKVLGQLKASVKEGE